MHPATARQWSAESSTTGVNVRLLVLGAQKVRAICNYQAWNLPNQPSPDAISLPIFLRTAALGAVVLGHWVMAAIWVDDTGLHAGNVLNFAYYLWPITWVLLLVPLFFLVGGFANATSWQRIQRQGGSYSRFLRRRLGGLLPPIIPFLLVVAAGVGAALALGAPKNLVVGVAVVVVMPLWFLAVYIVLALATKPMLALHQRFGIKVWCAMALAGVGFDLLRFTTGDSWVAFPNYFFVWGLAQQIGFAYADGSLVKMKTRVLTTWAVVAWGLLILTVTIGPWPPSMIGISGERSNFAPPAVPALLLMLAQIPTLLLLRPALNRWLNRQRVAKSLSVASAFAMPAFLWHLPVLVAVTGIALALKVPMPYPASAAWWWSRPFVLMVLAAALTAFLLGLNKMRQRRLKSNHGSDASTREHTGAAGGAQH